jgi:hypothetical protein
LYLQHPDVTGCFSRVNFKRIHDQVNKYAHDMSDGEYRGHFRIYYYRTPASLNGLRIHRREGHDVFFVSWYTYTAVDQNRPWKADDASGIGLAGGDNPCIEVVADGNPESTAISLMFENQTRSARRECTVPILECREGKRVCFSDA